MIAGAAFVWRQPWSDLPDPGGAIRVDGDRVAGIEAAAPDGDLLWLPAPVNAHDHGRGLSPLAYGAPDDVLEAWLWDLWRTPKVDPYLTHLVAFGRMALSGVAGVVHNHVPQGPDMVGEARAVARAARDVGIRLAFVVPLLDRNLAGYDDGATVRANIGPAHWSALRAAQAMPPMEEQLAAVEAVAEAIDGPTVNTQYGPPGPQWTSEPGLSLIGAAVGRAGRRVHVHLLETAAQRDWMDRRHPGGAQGYFAAAGLLDDQLTLAHGVQLRPEEADAFALAGATLALNVSSNLRLASGAPNGGLLALSGLRLGVGLDGLAFDDDADILREIRLAALVLGPRGQDQNGLRRAAILRAAFADGRVALDGAAGDGIAVGAPADLLGLSVEALAADRVDDDPRTIAALALGRWRRDVVRELIVAGDRVVADGRLVRVDLAAAERELTEMARASRKDVPPSSWIAAARASAGRLRL